MITCLALCNNVTPVEAGPIKEVNIEEFEGQIVDDSLKKSHHSELRPSRSKSFASSMHENADDPQLEASSPDEVALVKFGFSLNQKLVERTRTDCTLQPIIGPNEKFDILASFPFTSESKKMGCLLRSQTTGKGIYYLKGAEVVMEHKIKAGARPSLKESCESLAMDGLRTLVFAQKVLSE